MWQQPLPRRTGLVVWSPRALPKPHRLAPEKPLSFLQEKWSFSPAGFVGWVPSIHTRPSDTHTHAAWAHARRHRFERHTRPPLAPRGTRRPPPGLPDTLGASPPRALNPVHGSLLTPLAPQQDLLHLLEDKTPIGSLLLAPLIPVSAATQQATFLPRWRGATGQLRSEVPVKSPLSPYTLGGRHHSPALSSWFSKNPELSGQKQAGFPPVWEHRAALVLTLSSGIF